MNISACGAFTKNKERIQKFKETGDSRYIYRNELHKACFQHDKAYRDFKYFLQRAAADKVLLDKTFNIVKIRLMMDINAKLLQWFITLWIKSLLVVMLKVKLFQTNN